MGMRTMAQSLAELVRAGRVHISEAETSVSDASELRNLLRAA
jgi:hypothetical protein